MAFTTESVQVFLAVLDHGSFSAAARYLGRVPSAVSMAVAHLEAELGLELFDRRGREPRPTAAARALEPQARLVGGQLRALGAQALALGQGLEPRLTLAVAPELMSTQWIAPLQAIAAEHPLLEVEVLAAPQADALRLLHAGDAQLALVFERPGLDGREAFQEVGSETLTAVVAPHHPLAAQPPAGGLRDSDLAAARQIVVASRAADAVDPRFVFSRHVWRTDSPVAALGLLTAGLGWGWLPRNFVAPQLAAGTLQVLQLDNLTNGTPLWVDVVWSRERPLGLAARRFVELIAAARRASPAAG
ncbi:LysR family transcriptional regulator [uncultured Xylophilus sp.]|uniref:LysR family transcriptional regulator n=1 Tax=uncultured Xylophilus sp. TaxID=296832 RepID=UPI0025D6ED2C|nr:LysR family transcriptional regulator [uncultured Xylophilus sp.]